MTMQRYLPIEIIRLTVCCPDALFLIQGVLLRIIVFYGLNPNIQPHTYTPMRCYTTNTTSRVLRRCELLKYHSNDITPTHPNKHQHNVGAHMANHRRDKMAGKKIMLLTVHSINYVQILNSMSNFHWCVIFDYSLQH